MMMEKNLFCGFITAQKALNFSCTRHGNGGCHAQIKFFNFAFPDFVIDDA